MTQIDFGACKLFTDVDIRLDNPAIAIVPIPRIGSSTAYSDFLLSHMVNHIGTSHCLVVQWDGHVLNADRWLPEFLGYDYIGASWPQFDDGHDVGNGGFSLRSRRLMEVCRDTAFHASHPEDIAIGRINRDWLEGEGMRFAPRVLADLFAAERSGNPETSFGYHGVWHMPRCVGREAFWQIYRDLDDRGTVRYNFASILKDIGPGRGGFSRMVRLILDQMTGSGQPR